MIYTLTAHAAVDRVLCLDGLAGGEDVLRSELVALLAAGKGFNVSRDLAALGIGSVAAGIVGRSEVAFYRDSFAEIGVDVLLEATGAPTRCNVTLLDRADGRDRHLRERGPEVAAEVLEALASRLAGMLGPGDILAACGSLPPGLSCDDLAGALGLFRDRGARVLLDSSGEALGVVGRGAVDVLKVNGEELGEIVGRAPAGLEEAVRAAEEVRASGTEVVLVTMGAAGAVASSAEGAWTAVGPEVEAVNTVGAGDAFTAGFLSAADSGVAEALMTAAACGAAQAASGHIGLLMAPDAEKLRAGVVVSRA
ncbi:MAG: 1-phosphofructokinase family hexose kinase [Planctomycetota bacterium]